MRISCLYSIGDNRRMDLIPPREDFTRLCFTCYKSFRTAEERHYHEKIEHFTKFPTSTEKETAPQSDSEDIKVLSSKEKDIIKRKIINRRTFLSSWHHISGLRTLDEDRELKRCSEESQETCESEKSHKRKREYSKTSKGKLHADSNSYVKNPYFKKTRNNSSM